MPSNIPETYVRITVKNTTYDVRGCPACQCKNVEVLNVNNGKCVVCQNTGCGMRGPKRKRTQWAVEAWNNLPRGRDNRLFKISAPSKIFNRMADAWHNT